MSILTQALISTTIWHWQELFQQWLHFEMILISIESRESDHFWIWVPLKCDFESLTMWFKRQISISFDHIRRSSFQYFECEVFAWKEFRLMNFHFPPHYDSQISPHITHENILIKQNLLWLNAESNVSIKAHNLLKNTQQL